MPASSIAELIERSGEGGTGDDGTFGSDGEGSGNLGVPQRAYVTGMILALGGILMFFMALISAWVVRRGLSNSDWQPIEIPRVLWLNTMILLASSLTLVRSRRCVLAGRDAGYRYWWGVTATLGIFFVAGQFMAWHQMFAAGLFLGTNPSASFFYVFTAAHGLHVVGGTAALLLVARRSLRRLTRETATRVVALYWHFLCALWLLIVALLWIGK